MQAAIEVLAYAVKLDQQGQFQRAVDKYAEGVQLLMIPLKNERGTYVLAIVKSIRHKTKTQKQIQVVEPI